MKITRAQKDAVISLLKEKFDEKQKIANEKFLKDNRRKIDAELNAFAEDEVKLEALLREAREIYLKWHKEDKNRLSSVQLNINYGWNWDDTKELVIKHADEDLHRYVKYPVIDHPVYSKVERQLELDTLSKDFDLDKFIEKYLN